MKFSKMHGTGNDYVYVNCLTTKLDNPDQIAIKVSDRHFGIGSDGLVLILPSAVADFRMQMFNADGSESGMCGNASRCVGKYVYDRKLTDKTNITLETLSGIKHLDLQVENDKVVSVIVDMGAAILNAPLIPVKTNLDSFIKQDITVEDKIYNITCVSMGNPHAITFVDDTEAIEIEKIGPKFEHHSLFPERINTEFIQVLDKNNIKMRVWERGSGETWACGTGACASVVACVINGFCEYNQPVNVHLRGGVLKVTYQKNGQVFMQGPAEHVFDGEIEL